MIARVFEFSKRAMERGLQSASTFELKSPLNRLALSNFRELKRRERRAPSASLFNRQEVAP